MYFTRHVITNFFSKITILKYLLFLVTHCYKDENEILLDKYKG